MAKITFDQLKKAGLKEGKPSKEALADAAKQIAKTRDEQILDDLYRLANTPHKVR